MPGRVFLFSSCNWMNPQYYSFRTDSDSMVEVTQEMLSWPVRFKKSDIPDVGETTEIDVYKNVLMALTKLEGFVSVIALKVHFKEKWIELYHERRVAIYFDNRIVFDSGVLRGYMSVPDLLKWLDVGSNVAINWSADDWKNSFLTLVSNIAEMHLAHSREDEQVAVNKVKRYESVLRHLGKLPEENEIEFKTLHECLLDTFEIAMEECNKIDSNTRYDIAQNSINGLGVLFGDNSIPDVYLPELIKRLQKYAGSGNSISRKVTSLVEMSSAALSIK